MQIKFVTPSTRTSRLVADVELHFELELPGLKLVGFKLWRKPGPSSRDEYYVTLPSRAFNKGHERGYFDYLRSAREHYEDTDGIRQEIIDAYKDNRQ
jgi:hypothetical protein